jgi:hypothetical protein
MIMAIDKHRWPVRLNLRPGDNGTKKLLQKYGDRLVCVRYRYDASGGMRYKTVELVEEVYPWNGSGASQNGRPKEYTPAPNERFGVKVDFHETELRDRVKAAGGIWRPRQKLWELAYAQIEALGLGDRIVGAGQDG